VTVLEGVGAVVVGVGGLFLFVTAIAAVLALTEVVSSRRFTRSPVLTCQELTQARTLPRRVLVTGWVRTGPGGPVAAPVSGGYGPWYTVSVRIAVEEQRTTFKEVGVPEAVTLQDHTGWVLLSGDALTTMLLDDDSSTGIDRGHFAGRHAQQEDLPALLPRLAAVGLFVDHKRALSPGSDTSVYELQCHDAAPVTVLARPRRTGTGVMLLTGRGDGISVRSVQDLRDRATGETQDTLHTARWLLVTRAVLPSPSRSVAPRSCTAAPTTRRACSSSVP
jgi:hypothetical protein